jgi:glyoxylase-like metal-dependent hydrolase (beta-lactamase superfamily II)
VPAETSIAAHRNVPELQRAAATVDNSLDKQVFAATLFDKDWQRELGDETVRAYHFGPAHTGGDAVLHFEKANVVHVGDLVFNKLYPFIDRRGGASITGWMNVLEKLHKQFAGGSSADTIFIFGHGKPAAGVTGSGKELLEMRDYLGGLLEFVRKEIAAGKSKDDIVKNETLPGFEAYHDPRPNRLGQNLTTAFEELTGAPKS